MSETLDDLFAAYEQAVREDSEEWKAEFRRRIEGVLRVEAEAARPSRAAEPLDGLGWAAWITSQTRRTDWACRECVDADVRGQDEMVAPGFRCVWHEASAFLAAPHEPKEPTDEQR